jgi:hypothetical protein
MLRSMGKLPSQQNQNTLKVENDPFVPPPVETETYNEEDALNDLMNEMENEQNVPEDTIDIFNVQFDDDLVSEPEVAPIIVPAIVPKPTEIDEEEALIRQMEEEAMEEFTFEEEEELTPTTDVEEIPDDLFEEPEEFVEPTLDDEGLYIGPTTVIKGNHLLELDKGNYVVVGTFTNYRDAEDHSDELFIKGFYTKFGYISQTKIYYVYIFSNEDLQEAKDTSERFNAIGAKFKENWVLQVQ